MAEALREEIMIPLDLAEVRQSVRDGVDPSGRYSNASIETAMHAVLPHAVVLHVHCVDTIAWAVRRDAYVQLEKRLEGLEWQWIPYTESGLPLAKAMERAVAGSRETNVFVLGNHGLVIAGDDAESVAERLAEVRRRLSISPRKAHPADYSVLWELSMDSPWEIPEDDAVHALATDETARRILASGLLYPCQSIFSEGERTFHPIALSNIDRRSYGNRPFLIVEGRGVVTRRAMPEAELAMISGLAQVVQRLNAPSELRYLTAGEIAGVTGEVAYRYRTLASAGRG